MDQRTLPQPRLAPLPPEHTPELAEHFAASKKSMGFVPNSHLIMQRKPAMLKAFGQLSRSIFDPEGKVGVPFKRLIAHVASRAAGCQYCMAHAAERAHELGVSQEKLDALWDYQTSPLYTPAERAALDVAVAAGCVPNAVTDAMFDELKRHYGEDEIVEIVGVIALFGFLNRWNDTMATPLEAAPTAYGEAHLSAHGWDAGKHRR